MTDSLTVDARTRCDVSQSEAATILFRVGRHDLAFCAHHWRKHEHKLAEAGAEIITAHEDLDLASGFLVPVQPGASEPVPDTIPHGFTAEAPSGL